MQLDGRLRHRVGCCGGSPSLEFGRRDGDAGMVVIPLTGAIRLFDQPVVAATATIRVFAVAIVFKVGRTARDALHVMLLNIVKR